MRQATIKRDTKETKITVSVNLDGKGENDLSTGIGFFDHMLDQLGRHSLIDLTVKAEGDLHIDAHHTVEDVGIALGTAIAQALGDKKGIYRFGHAYAPMDESLSRAAIDLSGRAYLVIKADFTTNRLGEMDTELVREFFQAFSQGAKMNLHIENLYGDNNHHICESIFKAVAKALEHAVNYNTRAEGVLPSTKGVL